MARDMLRWGTQWLADKLKANASREVEYRRGGECIPLTVTVGKKLLRVTDNYGDAQIVTADRDYLFSAADLILNGEVAVPLKGDVIADSTEGTTALYEVLAPANEPEYQTEQQGVLTRVHCKKMGAE